MNGLIRAMTTVAMKSIVLFWGVTIHYSLEMFFGTNNLLFAAYVLFIKVRSCL